MVVGSEPEVDALAYGLAILSAMGQSAAAEGPAPSAAAGPVPGRLIVQGATRPLLVGPGTVLTHVRTFRQVEVLLAWRQGGVDWIQARNELQRVFSERAAAFDLFEGDALSQGESSGSSFFSTAQVECLNPSCDFCAHTAVGEDCHFYGYCCGCCRLKHRGEYCIMDHGPHCQRLYSRSLNWGDGAAWLENPETPDDRLRGETLLDRRGDGMIAPLDLLNRLLGESSQDCHLDGALPLDRPQDEVSPLPTQRQEGEAGNEHNGEATDQLAIGRGRGGDGSCGLLPAGSATPDHTRPSTEAQAATSAQRAAVPQTEPTLDVEPSRPAVDAETAETACTQPHAQGPDAFEHTTADLQQHVTLLCVDGDEFVVPRKHKRNNAAAVHTYLGRLQHS